jgi:hypothetical protein
MTTAWQPHKPPKDYFDKQRQRRVWQSQPPLLADWAIWFVAASIIAGLWIGVWIVYSK